MYSLILDNKFIRSSFYPEKEESTGFKFEQWIYEHFGYFSLPLKTRFRPYWAFVNRVNEIEASYKAANDLELKNEIRIDAFSKQQFDQEDTIARIFAGVRIVSKRKLGLRHYDEQLIGGRLLLKGMVAEMETGSGKTLTATLPACCAALAGIPVHIITVNDYLAQRDAEWMKPIYEFFNLRVGVVTPGMSLEERRSAYRCSITYCTNKEIVFDYLRDRLLLGKRPGFIQAKLENFYSKNSLLQSLRLRGLPFAIVDEADSILIDEARTPLILSGKSDDSYENKMYLDALDIARQLERKKDYTYDSSQHSMRLTEEGKQTLENLVEYLRGIWNHRRWREDITTKALNAINIFHNDHDYIVRDDKVLIVDPHTGRIMPDRSWEHGLHQLIETKESCKVTARNEPLARLSYQKFFRRYYHLSGMTGTAREVDRELWRVYRLPVVTVPSHRPSRRKKCPDQLYSTEEKKLEAILMRVKQLNSEGRPVLIGTRTVESSERICGYLKRDGLSHRVLNARQDKHEAEIIKEAGLKGKITVATNMAGRGTDISLPEEVKELGGFHIICTERHDSSRVDRQLFGRCGRQGDRGSYEYISSLEDNLLKPYAEKRIFHILKSFVHNNMPFGKELAIIFVKLAQKSIERKHYFMRWNLMKFDESMESAIAFSGEQE
ncbi:MAG: preprotein translocase subunit SecA [Desulfobacteraceae bacterium]|nr:preprotein translocase subunit SecA [Desulfobacteraceae bacterium]MBC2755132.1 preprotein translocase subunit SecA [Desulfobacteraceae bacterium]